MESVNNLNFLMNYQDSLKVMQPNVANTISETTNEKNVKFSNVLNQAIENLNGNLAVVDQDSKNVITGKETDLGGVMTRMTEAQLTLQTAVQVRNKCLEAYNDLKNMQF